jgi:hypothetical protein
MGWILSRRKPGNMRALERLGREPLGRYFYMRDFLMSEISAFHGVPNVPNIPDLAVSRGRELAKALLDPLQETFGRIAVRSAYRSAELNAYGNRHNLSCARNDNPMECHVWDQPQIEVAGASVVIPWFARRYAQGRDWRDLAWWLHDHLPYSELCFFPKLCAFNLVWRPVRKRCIYSYIMPRGYLLRSGAEPQETVIVRQARYADFPSFRAQTCSL